MNIRDAKIIGFVPSQDLAKAQHFYSDTLGLALAGSDEYALEYKLGDSRLRIVKVPQSPKADHTILGWEVDNIDTTVRALVDKGVEFIRFPGMPQDDLGICSFPGSGKVAWFKDADGNTLSVTQF